MSTSEKHSATENVGTTPAAVIEGGELELPNSWKYRTRKIGGINIPWYASPETQLVLVAFVCFLCPGMFNALNGLGGGGLFNTRASDVANTALYSTFAVVGFLAGSITNRLGIRTTLALGGIGYSVYVSGYLCYLYTSNIGYVGFSGALLGVCAGMLWSAQGAIMMSYPPERSKGRYIATFWIIFNLGAVIGALVPLGQNIHTTSQSSVNTGTYIAFLVLTFCGALLGLTLANGDDIIRRDGSKVILMKHPTWTTEVWGLVQTFKTDPYILLLFPMFFSSNIFYTYQFNDYNAARFNTRTRALNSVLYWTAQIIGASIMGFFLDFNRIRRTTRAYAAWGILLALTMAIWGGGYAFQNYTRAEATHTSGPKNTPDPLVMIFDWTDSGYIGPMFLYIFYGMFDAIWQTCVYWFMGSITNNGRKLANFAGFYKGIQSAGAAIYWRIDDIGVPYLNIFASTWALLAASLIFALPVMILKITDTTPIEEDLKFSDETVDDVLAHKAVDGHDDQLSA